MKNKIWNYSIVLMGFVLIFSIGCKKDNLKPDSSAFGSMLDIDGNVYKTITIGGQIWMAENLKTTKYRNGTSITNAEGVTEWINDTAGAYCNYNNDANNSIIYGKLYNWNAVNNGQNIAPTGWHVPSKAEWEILITYLGEQDAGSKLKENGTTHWNYFPYTEGTNQTGFTALPGGCRLETGVFTNIGDNGYWWTSTEYGELSYSRTISYKSKNVINYNYFRKAGFSVRCVKD